MHNCAARQLAELRPCGRAGRPAKHTKNNKFLACIQFARRHTTRPSPSGRVLMCTLRIRAAAALRHARATCGKRRQRPSAKCNMQFFFSFPFVVMFCICLRRSSHIRLLEVQCNALQSRAIDCSILAQADKSS